MTTRISPLLVLIGVLGAIPSLQAQVGDPTLRTNHPQYAGEGAFQTAADCVRFAEQAAAKNGTVLSEQDRAIAIYNWLLTHQWHLASPQENTIPGRTADTNKGHQDLIVHDATKARFSYGYGLCGTVHAWNEAYWKAAGFEARRRAFPGHTNSEIFYGGSWHAFDTDMAGLLFRKDGVVAGYADVIADPSLATSTKPPYPHYPFAWPGDFNAMKKGWQEVANNPDKWFVMYNGGYEAHPGIVYLRRGESFTRWFDPDHYGGPSKRRFWHNMKGGPFRDWTFANNGEPRHDGPQHNARGNARYCNGEFVWTVKRVPLDRTLATYFAKFDHFSPYVICGDPDDDANPMTGRATGGLVVEGEISAGATVSVSVDGGQSWQRVESNKLPLDLTEYVKGHYGWQIVFSWDRREYPDPEIRLLKFTTTTQVNQALYPRLKPGGAEVTYHAANRAAFDATPTFAPGEEPDSPEYVAHRAKNVVYHGRSSQSPHVYQTTDNKPASLVFPVRAPWPLTEVRAAMRYQVRVPPPEKYDYRLEISTDQGKTWQTFAQADIPRDNELSNGWVAGTANVSPAKVKDALVRITLYAGGYRTGLLDLRLYGVYETELPGAVNVTYGWKENGELKTHVQTIGKRTQDRTWTIATGQNIRDEFVRIVAED